MYEFLGGAGLFVAGGIFGVVCDRVWQKVEKRVRLRIQGSCPFVGRKGAWSAEGIAFKVKNEGKERLPPIRLCVFSPNMGSFYVFPPQDPESKLSELWPGQEPQVLVGT